MRKAILILAGAMLLPSICIGAYKSEEMCIIHWGEGENELEAAPTHYEAKGLPNEDVFPSQGPSMGFVDDKENIFFSSYDYGYLKGFNREGKLIKDLMGHDTQLRKEMEGQTVDGFIIDSSLVYVIGFPGLAVIPVADYNGNVVGELEPYDRGQWAMIFGLVLNYDGSMNIDRMMFRSRNSSRYVVTYRNGKFYPGGSLGFLSSNGSYYAAWQNGPHKLGFNRFNNPDTAGETNDIVTTTMDFPSDSIEYAEILNGGNGSRLFVFVRNIKANYITDDVWEFNLDYDLLSKVVFPLTENKYDQSLVPFVSHDGAIYEFRCLDDGLHVMKWTKE